MLFVTILVAALLTIVNGSDPVLVCLGCCRVCGEGKKVGYPDKLLFDPKEVVTGFSHYTCAEAEWKAYEEELDDSELCSLFQWKASERCGCTPGVINKPISKPTPAPTRKPTRKPTPGLTPGPTRKPTRKPTRMPTRKPTPMPTKGKNPK